MDGHHIDDSSLGVKLIRHHILHTCGVMDSGSVLRSSRAKYVYGK